MTAPNRLAGEKSPYLLQHAHNPVDWFPWGQEAFDRARTEHKPIFLSVGYSTCHWCHVMERESFEDEATAEILNRSYVSIKVDREERPDIDHVYMTFVQATTGSGGWPMSVFLTPELSPFFGGTYFPPEARYGSPGFRQILLGIAREWQQDPVGILASAARVIAALKSAGQSTMSVSSLGPDILQKCFRHFLSAYDHKHGGFEGAPKFPRPVVFAFLLRHYHRTGKREALDMTVQTLKKMAAGGMHDHLGGGFHRYSVDAAWHVPHFEKMLYDQAQLATAYVEAWQVTHDDEFLRILESTLHYVVKDLTSPDGAFYSAEDADSPLPDTPSVKGEGAYYVWRRDEVRDALDPVPFRLFADAYDVRAGGNVEHDPHGEFADQNILQRVRSVEALASAHDMPVDQVEASLTASRLLLEARRSARPRPHLDDKVLAAWNGMMISAMARASDILDSAPYRGAAVRAGQFLWDTLRDAVSGELHRRYRDGDAGLEGQLDDYAHTVRAFVDLYEATFDTLWLERAIALQEKQDELFWGEEEGAWFDTTGRDPSVLLRSRSDYDGAEPSPNSVAVLNVLRLGWLVGRPLWVQRGERVLRALGGRTPAAIPNLLAAADWTFSPPVQLVVVGDPAESKTHDLLREIRRHFLPGRILLGMHGGGLLLQWHPYLAAMHGSGTVYLCENGTCRLPTTDVKSLEALLTGLS